jgi:uncharacterized protein (DUF983 family)
MSSKRERIPLNPGFKGIVRRKDFSIEAGQLFRCPKCKGILMEAVAEKIKTRCKHCGRWVYLEKVKEFEKT